MRPRSAVKSPKLACLVLAAGGSSRLGEPKQLVRHRGRTLLAHAVRTALDIAAGPAVVVLGAQRLRMQLTLRRLQGNVRIPGSRRILVAVNARWRTGLASSLAAGLAALPRDIDAVLVLVVDQPRLNRTALARLIAAWRRRPSVPAAAYYAQRAGVPAILPRASWPAAAALSGDAGARNVLRSARHVTLVPMPEAAFDVDTPADLAAIRSWSRN